MSFTFTNADVHAILTIAKQARMLPDVSGHVFSEPLINYAEDNNSAAERLVRELQMLYTPEANEDQDLYEAYKREASAEIFFDEHEAIVTSAYDHAMHMWDHRHWFALFLKNSLLSTIVSEFFLSYFLFDEAVPVFTTVFEFMQFGVAASFLSYILSAYLCYGVNLCTDIMSEKPKENTIAALQSLWIIRLYCEKAYENIWKYALSTVLSVISFIMYFFMAISFSMSDYRQVEASANHFVPRLILYGFALFPSLIKLYNAYHRPVDERNRNGVPFWSLVTAAFSAYFMFIELGFQNSSSYALDVQYWVSVPYCLLITLVLISGYAWQIKAVIETPIKFQKYLAEYIKGFAQNPLNNIAFGLNTFMQGMLQFWGRGFTASIIVIMNAPALWSFSKPQLNVMSLLALVSCGFAALCTSVRNAAPFPHVMSGTKSNALYREIYLKEIVKDGGVIPQSQFTWMNGIYHFIQLVCFPAIGFLGTQAGLVMCGQASGDDYSPFAWGMAVMLCVHQLYVAYHTCYAAAGFADLEVLVKDMTKLKKAMSEASASIALTEGDLEEVSDLETLTRHTSMLYASAAALEEALNVLKEKHDETIDLFQEASDLIERTNQLGDDFNTRVSQQSGASVAVPEAKKTITWGQKAVPFQREMLIRGVLQGVFFARFLMTYLEGNDELSYALATAVTIPFAYTRYVYYRGHVYSHALTAFYYDTWRPTIVPALSAIKNNVSAFAEALEGEEIAEGSYVQMP